MTDFAEKTRIEAVVALRQTEKALLVEMPDGDRYWIPQKIIDDDSEVWREGQEGTLVLAAWWAEKEGLGG